LSGVLKGRTAPLYIFVFKKIFEMALLNFVSGDFLTLWIQQRDVRKYLTGFLETHDLHYVHKTMMDSIEVIEDIIERGYLKQLAQTLSLLGCDYETLIVVAARAGQLEILKWLKLQVSLPWKWNTRVCAAAALNGHLEVLKWLRAEGAPWDEYTCVNAAENGHLDVIKWAWERKPPAFYSLRMCCAAAEMGHLEILKWFFDSGYHCNLLFIMQSARIHDQYHVYKWAKQQDRIWMRERDRRFGEEMDDDYYDAMHSDDDSDEE
jgi:hypothetical protein